MAFPPTYRHADSDADDEYERSVVTSPHLADDSEASPTDSEVQTAENTPTTYGNVMDDRNSPRTIITEWTAEECANFAAGLGLSQYGDAFLENEIVGEALIALKHDELKEMGISSVGHRLTILKSVYEAKVKQGIPLDPDHYVPLSAEQNNTKEVATQEDISLLIRTIRKRDERLAAAEIELRKLADDYRRLREELLPVFKFTKDRSQPLPYQPSSYGGSTLIPDHDQNTTSPSLGNTLERTGSSLTRTFSKKLFAGGTTPKTSSPTHVPQPIPEGRAFNDTSTLDPSAAAMAASSHLTASMNGGQPSPKGIPSPTSPAGFYPPQTLASRSYTRETGPANSNRPIYDHSDDRQERSTIHPDNASTRNANPNDPSGPSVEIFKSFRVSIEDPCYKVLPAALKKYNINEDWRNYALYIVYGDQERCLGLEEKPLILFKQLQKDGRNPMFMLRRHTPIADGQAPSIYPVPPGTAGGGDGGNLGGGPGGGQIPTIGRPQMQPGMIQLPGGVL